MGIKICDMHMHVVPGVDDGSTDIAMSLQMLGCAYEQGAQDIFCTSHNGYLKEETERYKARFMMLQMMAKSRFPDLTLHMGCVLLCAGEYMDDILYGLEEGVFLPLGNSKCVLTELYPDTTPDEAKTVVSAMLGAGWTPILAHVERYPFLFEGKTLEEIIELGAMIQVNLYSLNEERDEGIKRRARYLVDNRLAHFIGSDAHRINRRAPKYEAGIRYLTEHCEQEYAEKLCFKNAGETILKT